MILIFEQDLTHYRASFYDYLSQVVGEEILILYGQGEPNSNHIFSFDDKDRRFKVLEIKRKWIGRSFYVQSLSSISDVLIHYDVKCVIHRGAIRNLTLLREINFFRKRGIPVILRGIGYSVRRKFNPTRNLIDRLHKKIIDRANAYLCYTRGSKELLDGHYDPQKIFIAVNTLNSDILTSHYNRLSATGKDRIKEELNLTKDRYIIHVGRLTTRKKISKLIDIYACFKEKRLDNIGLIIVGDGPHKASLQNYALSKGITDIVFTGAMSSESILTSKYIFSADIMVIPGNLGLTVNHAFFFGKPVVGYVISEDQRPPQNYLHGPEHEYLIDDFNGKIVRDERVESYVTAITQILDNNRYSDNALDYARNNLTVQEMAQGYLEAVKFVTTNKVT